MRSIAFGFLMLLLITGISYGQSERYTGGSGQGYTMSGTGLGGVILPVVWSGFNLSQHEDRILIEWSTSEEINNDYFLVQRSADGVNFEAISKVSGMGSVTVEKQYKAYDKTPHFRLNYYRIKQVDYDGRYDFSEIKSLYFDPDGASTRKRRVECLINGNLYPVFVEQADNNSPVSVRLINVMGQVLYEERFTDNESRGSNAVVSISKHLQTGIYHLVLSGNNVQAVKKILVR